MTSPATVTVLPFSNQCLLLWVKEKSSLLPSCLQRSNFPGQETAAATLPGALGKRVLSGSNLVSSAIPIKTQYLKEETKWILATTLILPGRELKYFRGSSGRCLVSKLDGSLGYFDLGFFGIERKGELEKHTS